MIKPILWGKKHKIKTYEPSAQGYVASRVVRFEPRSVCPQIKAFPSTPGWERSGIILVQDVIGTR